MWYQGLLDRGWVPDSLIRQAIRRRCRNQLRRQAARGAEAKAEFVAELKTLPIAVNTDDANEQHYELPPEFFTTVLGGRRKYSCGYWPDGVRTLDESEERMLALTVERAELVDGQRILELGCGWGSLTLYMAERFPASRILAVSNSRPQRLFIETEAQARGLTNVEVVTADMNDFDPGDVFDRVVSVEMFEHMKNYGELLKRIATWLTADGALFVHMFVHDRYAYHYEADGPDDWMAKYFFTGGTMPSEDLLDQFGEDLKTVERWQVPGVHYRDTCEAWLTKMDANEAAVRDILSTAYGPDLEDRWWMRWRIFFMACAELFAFESGKQWYVGHYLLKRSG